MFDASDDDRASRIIKRIMYTSTIALGIFTILRGVDLYHELTIFGVSLLGWAPTFSDPDAGLTCIVTGLLVAGTGVWAMWFIESDYKDSQRSARHRERSTMTYKRSSRLGESDKKPETCTDLDEINAKLDEINARLDRWDDRHGKP